MIARLEKSKMLVITVCAVMLLAVEGCSKKDVYDPSKNPSVDLPVFDFSTRESYTLNLKYDVPTGYRVYFEVYTQDPEQLDADGQVVKRDIEPVDVGFTDEEGIYNQKINVPASAKLLYIYSPYAGVPRVLVSEVNGGTLSEPGYPDEVIGARSVLSRAGDDYKNEKYNQVVGLERLGFWKNSKGEFLYKDRLYDLYGRPDDAFHGLTVSSDILRLINQVLPESKNNAVNPELIKNGDIHVRKNAHIDLCLVDENTSANSTLAYYCYETGNPPQKETDIKDIIIAFPNSKVLKYHNYAPHGYNGALERGEGVRLHYWKDGKDMGDEFPAGVSIGWVLYNQSYQPCLSGNGSINAKAKHFFADQKLNPKGKGHVALFKSGDKVIMGFEDWTNDNDYNDVVFYVNSDPIEAITPDIPDVKPEEPDDSKVAAEVTYRGIVTFEDIWPYRGDFDMNDVVVKYVSVVGYNMNNEVLQTKDNYTILGSGASIDNSFAYQLDVKKSDVEVHFASSLGGTGGAYVDQTLDRATIRLANQVLGYANQEVKTTFSVETRYTGRKIAKGDFTHPPYNPFITTTDLDIEVHLTNMRPTEKLNKEYLGKGHDRSDPSKNLYYVTFSEDGQQMPFGIDIAFEKDSDMDAFVIPAETKSIEIYYPRFLNWVKTKGQEDQDWYLHPRK